MKTARYGVALGAAAASLMLAPPAMAAPEYSVNYCGYTKDVMDGSLRRCGTGWFYDPSTWEQLKVQDNNQDGHSAVLFWSRGGTDFGSVWATSGVGTATTEDVNFPEGVTVSFRVCAGEAGPAEILLDTCGSWRTVTT
ncbi:hypothetical protein [Streptomyces sp. NPDC005485]|uniref:hypothetical protein n=1 Tax=Streptomyces sp. NPDC005485 TaxID=3155591 RepID=UPI00339FEDB1